MTISTSQGARADEAFARLFSQPTIDDGYDPFPDLGLLCEEAPVYRAPDGTVHLFRHVDIDGLLRQDGATTKDKVRYLFEYGLTPGSLLWEYFEHILFTTSPPAHLRQHEIVREVLTPYFAGMEHRIRAIASRLLSEIFARGDTFEVVSQFSNLLPVQVVGSMMDLDPAVFEQLGLWTEAMNRVLDQSRTPQQVEEAEEALRGFFSFFKQTMASHHSEGKNDLLSRLAQRMPDELELYSNAVTLFIAASESVGNAISQGILLFAEEPQLWQRLRAHPDLLEGLPDALLRRDAATMVALRQIGSTPYRCQNGEEIGPGEVVVLWLASAGRDPHVFDRPDELHLESHQNHRHRAFSQGSIHRCIGMPLAKKEIKGGFEELIQQTQGAIELISRVERKRTILFRGIARMEVRVTPRQVS